MNRVKELRLAAGMQQKELALSIGVRQPAISDWERQKSDPTNENIEKLMALFNVPRDQVICPAPQPEWNPQYPAGVAFRTSQPYQPGGLTLSESDISEIVRRVANYQQDARTTPVLNRSEQQLVEDFRLLSVAGRLRVQRLIGQLLDAKFNDPEM